MYQQLFIDGELVDIDNSTRVTLEFKSNLFQDVSKILSNKTLSVKLPKTALNQRIFGHSDLVQGGADRFPYKLHKAQYFRNGVELIKDGRAVCLSSSATDFQIFIIWGVFSQFASILNSGLSLSDLKSDASLRFGVGDYDLFEDAQSRGYFYAKYNPYYSVSEKEWDGFESNVRERTLSFIELEDGAIRTGTKIAGVVAPERDTSASEYLSAIVSFRAGQTLVLKNVVGGANDYRLFAVLTAENKVALLANPSTADTQAGNYEVEAPSNASRIIINVLKERSKDCLVILGGEKQPSGQNRGDRTFGGGGRIRQQNGQRTRVERRVHPSALSSWVLDLIQRNTGVRFNWSDEAAATIARLAIPLIDKKCEVSVSDGLLEGELLARDGNGRIQIKIPKESGLFGVVAGTVVDKLTAATDFALRFDVQGAWSFDASSAKAQSSSSVKIDGVWVTTYLYQFAHNYIEVRVTPADKKEEVRTYVVGRQNIDTIGAGDSAANLTNGRFSYFIAGYGKISLRQGDTLTFEMRNAVGQLTGVKFEGGSMRAALNDGDDVPEGGIFPIAKNLPNIKVVDFVKFLAAITGTFPVQITKQNEVRFVPFSVLWENIPRALNWSKKIVAQTLENKPNEVEYKIGEYAQRNFYRWKQDESVLGYYDGLLEIDNKTLEASKDIFTFPFAASDGDRVPMYEVNPTEGKTRSFDTRGGENVSYKACTARILRLYKDASGEAALTFDISMKTALKTKYAQLTESLQSIKVIKEKVILSDIDVLQFDERIPVYIEQYGAYFAVINIRLTDVGAAEVTMYKIKR